MKWGNAVLYREPLTQERRAVIEGALRNEASRAGFPDCVVMFGEEYEAAGWNKNTLPPGVSGANWRSIE